MAKFCPEWVFSASVAGVAGGFLSENHQLLFLQINFLTELMSIIQK